MKFYPLFFAFLLLVSLCSFSSNIEGIVLGGKNTGPNAQIIQSSYSGTSNYALTSNYTESCPPNILTSDYSFSVTINNSLRANTFSVDTMNMGAVIVKYNNISTIGKGIPSEVAAVDLLLQSDTINETTLYAVPSNGAGLYRVSWVASCATAASDASLLGGESGLQIRYTDADDSRVKTSSTVVNSSANTTGTCISGVVTAYCKASSNINFLMGYTSSGNPVMQYNLHIRLESL